MLFWSHVELRDVRKMGHTEDGSWTTQNQGIVQILFLTSSELNSFKISFTTPRYEYKSLSCEVKV